VDIPRTTIDETIDETRAKSLLLLSAVGVLVQHSWTDTRSPGLGPDPIWLVVDLVALVLVLRRRSRVARGYLVVMGAFGAVVFGLVAMGGGVYPVVMALACLTQTVPLLREPVRRHVRRPQRVAPPGHPTGAPAGV